jgi:hypothetical protein
MHLFAFDGLHCHISNFLVNKYKLLLTWLLLLTSTCGEE